MPKNRFAIPDITRYSLADGEDWVEFKNGLTWGERIRLSLSYSDIQNGRGEIDWGRYNPKRLEAYLSAWSFADPEGNGIPIDGDTLDSLSEETGDELIGLLDKHLAEQDALKNSTPSTPG